MTGRDGMLLPGWSEALATTPAAAVPRAPLLPMCPVGLASEIRLVDDAAKAEAMVTQLLSLDLCAIAVDSEFSFARPPLKLRSGRMWYDVRSQRPIAVGLAAWANDGSDAPPVVLFVLDVRRPEVVPALGRVLALPVPIVGHAVKNELFSFWALGLDPRIYHLVDTWVTAACLDLGRLHAKASTPVADAAEAIAANASLSAKRAHRLSLLGQCERYGLRHPFAGDKEDLRAQYLAIDDDRPLTPAQVAYAAADPLLTLKLYAAQQPEIVRQGIAKHLHCVEMRFALENALMEWRGVLMSVEAIAKARTGAASATAALASRLAGYGLVRPGSAVDFLALVDRLGLGRRFTRLTDTGRRAVDDRALEAAEGLHPAVGCLRMHRKYGRLAGEEVLSGRLVGSDGRTHPSHVQLGASTGRNSCSAPNVAGIGKAFRPVVMAPPDRALLDLDFAQIEIGIAAAEHGDPALIAAFNSGDLYSAIALRVCADRLTPEERALSPKAFKARRKDLRDQMKIFCLAILYGMQPPAIAAHLAQLGSPVTEAEAARQRDRFLGMFPNVKAGLEADGEFGVLRGHAGIRTGLRRHLPEGQARRGWLVNAMRNAPIQGGAAAVFKLAVVALGAEFYGTDVWLVLPVHDAVLIECPAGDVDTVAARAKAIMERALKSLYPMLDAKVDVNATATDCWNKDGGSASIEAFLADPLAALGLAPGGPTAKEGPP